MTFAKALLTQLTRDMSNVSTRNFWRTLGGGLKRTQYGVSNAVNHGILNSVSKPFNSVPRPMPIVIDFHSPLIFHSYLIFQVCAFKRSSHGRVMHDWIDKKKCSCSTFRSQIEMSKSKLNLCLYGKCYFKEILGLY